MSGNRQCAHIRRSSDAPTREKPRPVCMCPCDYSNSACSEGKSTINTRDMLLAFLLLQCFLCGSFAAQHEVCYGGTFHFPYDYSPRGLSGKLYFSPKNGEGRRLVFENGKAMDPRFKVTFGSLSLQHVTEKDNGYFSPSSSYFLDRITLKVLECADAVQRYYHSQYRVNIPSNAEILEFSTFDNSDLVILWNRTQSSGASRGQVKQNYWEMSDITQADNGYYNFRKKDYTLLTRKKLTVTEYTTNYQPKEGTHFTMRFPVSFKPWDITFKPRTGESDPIRVMRSGRLTNDDYFEDRFVLEGRNLEILSVKVEDSGIYELRDNNGYLVFVGNVAVEEGETQCILPLRNIS
ncbi:uncharacterized protein LOC127610725 [Hippocampus zosterae]|uniref:uncharacterized protein LOC127610725 n=1 Tax=Hippocampus zosterae TaxID=109293 RepID=UPI00223CB486|nr:uncharacterized protein LOC127610725 [Hippocampus zosterae]XP_051937156.1 uncharacterized protein LOC127610725 [Hippocampus zosterae]